MTQISVSRQISASPTVLYDMVSDLTRMGEWSPEATGGGWTSGSLPGIVGARFSGSNANGKKRWKTISIVDEAEPGKSFAFRVVVGPIKIARWGYRFDALDGGTKVTETWLDQRGWFVNKIGELASGVADRLSHNRLGMEQTLENLARVAEA